MTITDANIQRMSSQQAVVHLPRPRMPYAGLRLGLKTSPTLRRVLPTPWVVARAERKGERLFAEREETRAHAHRVMEAIVCGTEREGELQELARRYAIERQVWQALFWQPWRPPTIDDASRARLLAACDGERGALLSACHLGPFFCKSLALWEVGVEPVIVAGDWWFEPPSRDKWGRRLARWRRGTPDLPLARPRGTFELLASLLREGRQALVYYDLPGRHETRFLGKPVELVDGTARLAVAADALVLPMRSRRDGHRILQEFGEPLDPRAHDGVDELHDALARIHESSILEEPAAMNEPEEFGWKDQATATAWRRPGQPSRDGERNGERAAAAR
jgi:lauroyl/myristoyl acyltransferase